MNPINELKMGDYFGELSLLTNLRRTSTIYTLASTTCGFIENDDFEVLMKQNSELKATLLQKIYSYKDNYIKFLITMVKNVPQLRRLQTRSLRTLVHILRSYTAPAGSSILRTGQVVKKAFFVRNGRVKVVIKEFRQETNSYKSHHLATLTKGSSFNFLNSFMGRPTLFDFIATE
jgi:CRP-like cAMP-binding protein